MYFILSLMDYGMFSFAVNFNVQYILKHQFLVEFFTRFTSIANTCTGEEAVSALLLPHAGSGCRLLCAEGQATYSPEPGH